jgi:hypothetical protein
VARNAGNIQSNFESNLNMEINVPIEELRKKKLFVSTPMYGGACSGIYTNSMCQLSALCKAYDIEVRNFFLFNESLIQRARNYCVDEFLRSDCTHMIFIDADIGFDANAVLTLLALQTEESPYDVIAAPYPKKTISWEKIVMAVNKGFADKDPNALDQFVGDFVFNLEPGSMVAKLDEPIPVMETGTGFMMIRRSTFDKYKAAYPQYAYLPDHVRSANFDGSREIHAYFDCIIDPDTKRYLSEDYMFCQNVRKMGSHVYLCPWIELKHVGSMIFGGSLPAILSIGASPTADTSKLGTKR